MQKKKRFLQEIMMDDSLHRIDALLGHNTFSSMLVLNKKTKNAVIAASDFEIAYLPQFFYEADENYMNYQTTAHKQYHDVVHQEYIYMYESLIDLDEMCQHHGVTEGFRPDWIYNAQVLFNRIKSAPQIYREYRKTQKQVIKEEMERAEDELDRCVVIRKVMNYGKDLLHHHIPRFNGDISKETRTDLLQWQKTQDQLSFLYDCMVWIAKQKVHKQELVYKQVFPFSKYKSPKFSELYN